MKSYLKLRHFLALLTILAVAMVMVFTPVASQAVVLDFGIIAPTSGTINYAAVGGALVGLDIEVDNIIGIGTVANDGVVLNISGGDLDFTSGNLGDYTHPLWTFGNNTSLTSIQLHGGVDMDDDGNFNEVGVDILDGTLLMTGSIITSQVLAGSGDFKMEMTTFLDYKHKDLLVYYDLPRLGTTTIIGDPIDDFPYQGNLNLSFAASTNLDGTFNSSEIYSGDIVNDPVPEPSTLILLGFSLLGMVGFLRRKNG